MSDKYCCCTWETLGLELSEAKQADIELLMSEKGLPRSVFASVFKVLDKMQNYCPVCGSPLTTTTSYENAKPIVQKRPEPTTKRVDCPRCSGKKTFGKDSNGVVIRCMHCHGMGFVDQRHVVSEAKSAEEEAAEKRIAEFESQGDE